MKRHLQLLIALALCAVPMLARADWDPGDPSKYEQLPDPNGWDVAVTGSFLADDFLCTETGYITQLHFWGSWKGDNVGAISNIRVEFWTDNPDSDGPGPDYSKPFYPLWGNDFGPSWFTERLYDTGDQGWYDPVSGEFTPNEQRPDHVNIYEYNIDMSNLSLLFKQEATAAAPALYWLLIKVTLVNDEQFDFGWKTALDQHYDDAVYDAASEWPPDWHKLVDPGIVGAVVSLDLAFVLNGVPVPEPSVLVLVGVGLITLWRRKR
jgi:hypothetical protein